ncbi:hypothetical protein IKE83_00840 [Candidatus Saccharibacteria bacterium]|nr:hypothetical protein [Candidatus Saccharibacteria bacterium]
MGVFMPIVIIAGIVFIGFFIFAIAMFFSPKMRGKMIGKQMKATEHMLDAAGDTMVNIAAKNAKIQRAAMEKSKDDLTAINTMKAETEKEAIKTKAGAVREGLLGEKQK